MLGWQCFYSIFLLILTILRYDGIVEFTKGFLVVFLNGYFAFEAYQYLELEDGKIFKVNINRGREFKRDTS